MDGSFLFANDDRFEVAADGTGFVLHVVANDRNLTGTGQPVLGYSGGPGVAPVTVSAPGHGLATGAAVSIEGYGGTGLYNRVHRIEVVDAEGLVTNLPPQQYLGDLEENSPLPFSIPVDVGAAQEGTYPVKINVTYKDNLRQLHTLAFDSQVQFVPEVSEEDAAAGQGMDMSIPIVIGVIVAAAIAAVVLVKRRKRNQLKSAITAKKSDDIESLLDSHRQDKK